MQREYSHTIGTSPSVAIVALATLASGCTGVADLKPASTAQTTPSMEDAVVAEQDGIKVVASAEDWPGNAYIEAEVTPLHVVVRNDSDQAIQIRYGSFALTTSDGASYSAIPPRKVTGVVKDEEYVRPSMGHVGFSPAPYYGPYYGGVGVFEGPFYYDHDYYDTHSVYWDSTTELPTREMQVRALLEGVVDTGGYVDGYLYFERVQQRDGTRITLEANLRSSDDEQQVASLRLPFVVD